MLGLYDSGIGGLTILQEILKTNPDLDIIYLADNANLPLGEKTLDQIQDIVQKAVEKLFDLGCDLVILACNTATVNTIRYMQQVWLPESKWANSHRVLGIGQPLLEILEERKTDYADKKGLVLATHTTYKSGFYQSEIKQRGFHDLPVLPCFGLAGAIESFDEKIISKSLENIFNQPKAGLKEIEFIVLGCTHYKWAIESIQKYFSQKIKVIDNSEDVALRLKTYLERHPQFKSNTGKLKFYLTQSDSIGKYNSILEQKLELSCKFEIIA